MKSYENFTKKYSNRVFSYRCTERNFKNYSRKNFSESWNNNVFFNQCIFKQTDFNESFLENCTFENCLFLNCFITKSTIKNCKFENCKFENFSFELCSFSNSPFVNNNYKNTYFLPHSWKPPEGFVSTHIQNNLHIPHELNEALDLALKNDYIRNSNTLFLKKSQHLSGKEKKLMKIIKPKEAKKIGLSNKERLMENRKRRNLKKEWQRKVYQDSLAGKNRVISKNALNLLRTHYSDYKLVNGLNFASERLNQPFKNISYLIKFIDES